MSRISISQIKRDLEDNGAYNRACGYATLRAWRQQARRRRLVRLWAGRVVTIGGYLALTGAVVVLLL